MNFPQTLNLAMGLDVPAAAWNNAIDESYKK